MIGVYSDAQALAGGQATSPGQQSGRARIRGIQLTRPSDGPILLGVFHAHPVTLAQSKSAQSSLRIEHRHQQSDFSPSAVMRFLTLFKL